MHDERLSDTVELMMQSPRTFGGRLLVWLDAQTRARQFFDSLTYFTDEHYTLSLSHTSFSI